VQSKTEVKFGSYTRERANGGHATSHKCFIVTMATLAGARLEQLKRDSLIGYFINFNKLYTHCTRRPQVTNIERYCLFSLLQRGAVFVKMWEHSPTKDTN